MLSIIISMTIGIVVDDTVHFMSKYTRARREHNFDAVGAVRYSFNAVGTAMLVTTIVLIAGFLVLTFSGFRLNADMGWMSAITIGFALFMDFLLLPTLLMKLEKKNDEAIKANPGIDLDSAGFSSGFKRTESRRERACHSARG